MMTAIGICDLLASLVSYPRPGYAQRLEECARTLAREHPQAGEFLQPFLDQVRELSIENLEELYTLSFDINPLCCLEVGWQLFGEEYARGAFLVEMRQLLQECGVAESTELPDHLAHVLTLLERLPRERAGELAGKAVLPALKKMIDGLAGKENLFENVLKAIENVLQEQYAAHKEGESHD